MTTRGLFLLLLSALLTAAANLLLRGGILQYGEFSLSLNKIKDQLIVLGTQPMFVSGVIFYGLAAVVWFSVLSIENLSTSYPALVGVTFILVAVGAVYFFQEEFSWQKIFGMILILGGIVAIARA
jgi:multidrug transporter EmrE-like cation transporter